MDFDPKLYDNSNNDTLLPAKRLIEIINDFKPNDRKYPTILDIGCGSGNMTKLLSQEVECQHVIGCDIDRNMIDFAKKVNKNKQIEYLVQDIEEDWKLFCPELRALEGRISVITSNFALTWIKHIKTASQNIANMLSKDGVIVFNIVYDGDIFERLAPNQRIIAEQSLKYPKEEEMIGQWVQGLKKAGFTNLDIHYWEPKSIFTEKEYFDDYLNIPINWYKSYGKSLKNGQNIEMTELLKKLLFEDRCKRLAVKSIDGKDLIEVTNYIWQIVATKS